MFMEADDRRRLSLMELSETNATLLCHHSLARRYLLSQSLTQIQELVQEVSAEGHVCVGAELDAAELQLIEDLLTDRLQGIWVTHQVVHGPETGRDGVGHRCPQHGEVMSCQQTESTMET